MRNEGHLLSHVPSNITRVAASCQNPRGDTANKTFPLASQFFELAFRLCRAGHAQCTRAEAQVWLRNRPVEPEDNK